MNIFELMKLGRTETADGTAQYFRFLDQWNGGITAIVVLIIIAVSIYCYRKEPERMPKWAKSVAGFLRFAAAFAFILILWRPAITTEKIIKEKPYVLFIADSSLSMGITDSGTAQNIQSRNDEAVTLLARMAEIKNLNRFNTAYFRVGEHVKDETLQSLNDGKPEDKLSKVYENCLEILGRFRGRTVAAVYLFTDGNINGGVVNSSSFNITLKEDFPEIPFNIIGTGSRKKLTDGALLSITAPENVFVNEGIEVISRYSIEGALPAEITCILFENGKQIQTKKATALEKGEVVFTYKPERPGNTLLTCRLEAVPGEQHFKNNERTRIIRVYEGKLKILYVEGSPRWEFRYLKNALLRDKMAEVSTLLLSADPGFVQEGEIPINSFPDSKALEKYDVIIIGNADSSFFTEAQMFDIAESVEKKGTGVVFIPGSMETASSYIHTPFEDLIPVTVLPTERYSVFKEKRVYQPFRPEVRKEGWEHPVMQLTENMQQTKELWGMFPPLYKFVKTEGIKPGKTVIAVHPRNTGINEPEVIFAGGFYGVGKSFFSAVDSTWRWRFQSGDRYFYRFWLNVFRYVSSGRFSGGREPCLVLTGKQRFDMGEQIPVKVLIRDRNFKPFIRDSYQLTVIGPDKTEQKLILEPAEGRDGYYTGILFPRKPGMYTVQMTTPEGEDREFRKISIVLPEGEFRQMQLNEQGISEALQDTDGNVFSASEPGVLLAHLSGIRDETREEVVKSDTEIFNHPLLFLIILCGLSTEWVLRKLYRLN